MPNMDAVAFLVCVYWGLACAAALAPFVSNAAADWHSYGKLRLASSVNALDITVPKSWFLHFYVFGTAFVVIAGFAKVAVDVDPVGCVSACVESLGFTGRTGDPLSCQRPVLILTLLLVHTIRRATECRGAPASDARMHVGGYLVGATFYLATPFTFLTFYSCTKLNIWDVALVALWACASFAQAQIHAVFRKMRAKGAYALPPLRTVWFSSVTSPHYAAEIVAYAALVVLSHRPELCLPLAFVCLNLHLTASKTHAWYLERFNDPLLRERRPLFPFA